ncbi:lrr receptor-like serine threonine-protein kinase [Hordeum vulgare]|nr:lrr receptor-like serine threonine-protein kinase [Hordeum vulgare]
MLEDVVEGADTTADVIQEVAVIGGAGDAACIVAGSVAAAADQEEKGVVGSNSAVPDLVGDKHVVDVYNSGDNVEDGNKESFIQKEAQKIRDKGKASYFKRGKFMCPYCTIKPKPNDGFYEHLMSHARFLSTSADDIKIRAEHASLLKALGPI